MTSVQGVFNMPDGGPNTTKGALAEVERRKFTAEEGDHLTLLNGTSILPPLLCRRDELTHSLQRIHQVRSAGQELVRPAPFELPRPAACAEYPETAQEVSRAVRHPLSLVRRGPRAAPQVSRLGILQGKLHASQFDESWSETDTRTRPRCFRTDRTAARARARRCTRTHPQSCSRGNPPRAGSFSRTCWRRARALCAI